LLDHTNWRKRFIGSGHRKVLYSKELNNNFFYKYNKKFRKTIDKIAYKIKNAESLDPFLSKGIVDNPNEDDIKNLTKKIYRCNKLYRYYHLIQQDIYIKSN